MEMSIGFSKSNKIGSRVIRFCEGSDFSHVYIKWTSSYLERDIIYHASGHSVGFITTANFLALGNIVVLERKISITEATKKKIAQFCMDKASTPYGVKHLVGFGYVKLMRLFGKTVKNPFGDGPKTYICSELAAEVLNMTGSSFSDLDNVTPVMIYEALRG
jgi:hypothetical protein